MEAITKKGKRLFENVKQGVKTTVTETGLVDRRAIVINSHRRKCRQKAFWSQQIVTLRQIQSTLQENYEGSKMLLCCCCCLKEDLKTMIDEAVDDFLSIPKVLTPSGHQIPITADIDITDINLETFESDVPREQFYNTRSTGQLEQEKAQLKADIADLMKEHTERYTALQTLADRQRHFKLQEKDPSTKALKKMVRAAFRYEDTASA